MIFHHPGPVSMDARSGSQVRPWRLLQAFKSLGHEVEPIIGYGAERQQAMRRVLEDQSRGRRYDFVYSEARSIPTLLTEPHRLPRFPLLDFRFLRTLRNAGVPVGLFYRDVFWRFDMYRTMLPWLGRVTTVPLYWYDWYWYRRVVDHLFLPSMGMAPHLPTDWFADRCSALPPGALLPTTECDRNDVTADPSPLRLLYVGGVKPPSYDLRPLLAVLKQTPDIFLTLCCRLPEWGECQSLYAPLLTDRVEIVHLSGDALADQYARSDVFGLLWEPGEYLDFAVPVKLFESVGYGLPILTLKGTEAARIVETEGLGWVVDDVGQARDQLLALCQDRGQLAAVGQHVLAARARHTWEQRARRVAETLLRLDART
jgi:glycosyltransferase involved in cell wall biosynthesis